jgi:hypothetical protein
MYRPDADENKNEPAADEGPPSISGCGLALLGLTLGGMYRPSDPSQPDNPRFSTGKMVGLGVGLLLTPVMLIGIFWLAEVNFTEPIFFLLLSAPFIGMIVGMIGGGLGAEHFFTSRSSSDSSVKAGVLGAVLAILIVHLACALLIIYGK